jgi:lauroyl/myristoyl acyltransferase
MPPRLVDAIGIMLGTLAYKIFSARRRIVRRNLRIAWGETLDAAELERWTKQTFQDNGANLLGGMRCMLLDDEALQHYVTVEGQELVRETLKVGGSGAIFALCHMGNWETLARIASLVSPGTPAGAFYRPLNNPWMNRMTKRRRERSGTKLFSNKEGFNQSLPLLRSGGMLGILSDQHAGRSGCMSTFFGRTTTCSPLVELLQRRTKSSVFYVSIKRDAPAHWHISIRMHPAESPVTTPNIMAGLEKSLSLSPSDGFWMHNRWKQPAKRPLFHPFSRESLDPKSITKPWRWIFIGSEDPLIAKAAQEAMSFAANTAVHTEVEIIHHGNCANLSSHVTQYGKKSDLRKQIAEIDAEKSYPVDLVVCFLSSKEMKQISIDPSIPMVACVSPGKKSLGCLTVNTSKKWNEEKTWWDFIAQLGAKVPD